MDGFGGCQPIKNMENFAKHKNNIILDQRSSDLKVMVLWKSMSFLGKKT